MQESHSVEKLLHTLNGRKTELSQWMFHGFAATDQLGIHGLEKTRGATLENEVVKVGRTALQLGVRERKLSTKIAKYPQKGANKCILCNVRPV